MGKHTKKVTCGAWSAEGLLALGSEDKTITISNTEGDTLRQTALRADPNNVQFSEMKGDERSSIGENTVCIWKILVVCESWVYGEYWLFGKYWLSRKAGYMENTGYL